MWLCGTWILAGHSGMTRFLFSTQRNVAVNDIIAIWRLLLDDPDKAQTKKHDVSE